MNPGDWRDEANKTSANDKEVIINGVCVMNQSSDYKSNDGEDDDVNMDQSTDGGDEAVSRLSLSEGHDEDAIKKSFIKKPGMEKASLDSADDVKVKKEIDEAGAWEY